MAITVTDYQPDDTTAIDTYIKEDAPTSNYATNANFLYGKWTASTRGFILIRFDWIWRGLAGVNTPGANRKMKFTSDLELKIYCSASSGTYTADYYFVKRDWTESGVTWNTYDGSNAWQTAGGLGANDSMWVPIRGLWAGAGSWSTLYVTAGLLDKCIKGEYFGILLNGSNQDGWNSTLSSSSNATTANRPKYTFSYEPYHKVFPISAGLGQVR